MHGTLAIAFQTVYLILKWFYAASKDHMHSTLLWHEIYGQIISYTSTQARAFHLYLCKDMCLCYEISLNDSDKQILSDSCDQINYHKIICYDTLMKDHSSVYWYATWQRLRLLSFNDYYYPKTIYCSLHNEVRKSPLHLGSWNGWLNLSKDTLLTLQLAYIFSNNLSYDQVELKCET